MIDIHVTSHEPSAAFPYGCLYFHVRDHNTQITWGFNAMRPEELEEAKQAVIDMESALIDTLEKVQKFQSQLSKLEA